MAYPRPEKEGDRALTLRRPQQALQLMMHRFVTGHDMALGEHLIAAVDIGDVPARLAHQQNARRDVPRRDVAFPVGIEPAGRDPGEIEGSGPETAQAGNLVLDRGEFPAEKRQVPHAMMWQSAAD